MVEWKRSYLFWCLAAILGTWHTTVCLVGLAAGVLYATTHVYGPTRKYIPKVRSKILEDCAVSTDNRDDLIVEPYETEEEAFYTFDDHGSVIIPSVLFKDTAQTLRDYVSKNNPDMKQAFVLKGENRFRIMPTPFDEDIVARAMKEIATHPTLKPLVDNVLGPKSSLIAFSVITSTYGAKAQNWHRDTTKSAMTHPDKIIHELTLTIPLQDTTKEMGATGICPGTHRCNWMTDLIPNRTKQERVPCNITASLDQGDGLIYHTDLVHRGPAHIDPDAPDRSVLFVSFAQSKPVSTFKRLGYGKVYSLDYRLWGVTIDDFPHLGNFFWKWSFLHPLGFRFFGGNIGKYQDDDGEEEVRPWTAIDSCLHIFDRDTSCDLISQTFDKNEAKKWSGKALAWAIAFAGLYFWIGIPLWVYTVVQLFFSKEPPTSKKGSLP